MYFQHAAALWRDFPALVPGVLYAEGITAGAVAGTDHLTAIATARLAARARSQSSPRSRPGGAPSRGWA